MTGSRQAGRERLLETARRLFTRRGAANVGINEVTDTAGVARMTLYNNFASKEALTVAVYEQMAAATLQALRQLRRDGTEETRIEALFSFFESRTEQPDYRGCPMIHAGLQDAEPFGPIHSVVQRYKRQLREDVWHMLDEARANRSELADQMLLLLDGGVTEAYLKGVTRPMTAARRAAIVLLRNTPTGES